MPIEHFLAYHCGPALAGIKPANIASYSKAEKPGVLSEIEMLNRAFNGHDIYIDILCECQSRILVMVYRRGKLCEYLNSPKIKKLLNKYGYPKKFSLGTYLDILKKRVADGREMCGEFPHEIGAFLGYPIHDIYGFINHKDEGCLLTGEWKVYAEPEKAERMFCRYKACRRAILKRVCEGKTLEELFCIA
ncbi:MAG: DUF3793 family protein [Candidatus Ornithomonoglobus sp.]